MKFMMLVKHAENRAMPPKELMEAIGKLGKKRQRPATMISTGGLAPTAQSRKRTDFRRTDQVIDGPFTESKEIIGGYAQFELPSKEEAVKGAVAFMELHRKHWPSWEGETEIRQMFGPEDFDAQKMPECARPAQGRLPERPGLRAGTGAWCAG